jgi:lysophospholipase L1-like esterase
MKVVLIGDSIRMGYQGLVREKLGARAEVLAPAENCAHGLRVREGLHEWAIAPRPDVVHFNAGIHDLGWMAGETVPRFTISAYVRNLRIIVQRLHAQTSARLIFATTTPFLAPCNPSVPRHRCRPAAAVPRYNAAAVRLMRKVGVEIDDLCAAVMSAGIDECLGEDRIHMSARGNEVLADAVVRSLLGGGAARSGRGHG